MSLSGMTMTWHKNLYVDYKSFAQMNKNIEIEIYIWWRLFYMKNKEENKKLTEIYT